MRLGLRAREALAISLLVLAAVATTTFAHVAQLTRVVVREARQQADLVARQVYTQASRALARAAGQDPIGALRQDGELRTLVDASVGYSPHLLYVLIADHEGRVIVHSEPDKERGGAPEVPTLDHLLALDPLSRFLALYTASQTYEAELPVSLGGAPFGSVRLGLSTSLLRRELHGALGQSLALAGLALPVAWLVAMLLANLVLRPLRQVTRDLARLRQGEFEPAVAAPVSGRRDELGELAAQLQLLAQQLRAERSPAVEERTLQSLITYSAKLAALGRLTSGVAHEVKNPLNAMVIHVELVKERLRPPEPQLDAARESLDVIAAEIRRLDRVVQGFLRFVRPQELALKPVEPNPLLQSVATLLEAEWRERGVRFAVALDPECPAVSADEELLRQALLNVVVNACQAMPDGGTVTLTTEARPGSARIRVTDEGVGIPPEALEDIWRLYFTTKPDGSGIGLSVVYRIVQMHDGEIRVDSEVGRGTTVTIDLPVR